MNWLRYPNPSRWLTDEQRRQLDDMLLKIIIESYARYREYGGREPSLTTSYLVDEVTNNRRMLALDILRPTQRRSLVDSSLRRLLRRGLVTTSLCTGERHAEVKCWEPV
jgi:hypothetical protein